MPSGVQDARPHGRDLLHAARSSQASLRGPGEWFLATRPGSFLEGYSGDICSVLGVVGATIIATNHRNPGIERIGVSVVNASMAAAVVDTFIQGRNVAVDRGAGAQQRGHKRSTVGSIMYAATGIIPATSLAAMKGLHRHPSRSEVLGVTMLALNGAVLGYEMFHRVPRMLRGEEDFSGYGSFLASLGGFVVAKQIMR